MPCSAEVQGWWSYVGVAQFEHTADNMTGIQDIEHTVHIVWACYSNFRGVLRATFLAIFTLDEIAAATQGQLPFLSPKKSEKFL